MSVQYRRRVGAVRPSHLMFTGGVGALIDLPNFSTLVRGTDEWSYTDLPDWETISEPRLLDAVRTLLEAPTLKELRPAPWMEGLDQDPQGPASRVGAPVLAFPQWFRCTRCETLAPLDSHTFQFENAKARRPDEARFIHPDCSRKSRLAVPARFMLACINGHLDEFPYVAFVHHGDACPMATHPTLKMTDHGGNLGANVSIRCTNCDARRNIRAAMGKAGEVNLPRCRGRHPHLGTYEACDADPKLLVVGASNQWFASTLSVLAVPPTAASALDATISAEWELLRQVTAPETLPLLFQAAPKLRQLQQWPVDDVWAAISARQRAAEEPADAFSGSRIDLLTPEWDIFTTKPLPVPSPDFTLRQAEVAAPLQRIFTDVVQAERLREVRALVGFTRLDAPDPEDPDLVVRAPLARQQPPEWVLASEVRGEGIFVRVAEELLMPWEDHVSGSDELEAHRQAYARFRTNRYSDRIQTEFDPLRYWPGARYIALHTLSHLLIRTIALECGYSSASLSERIYAGSEDAPRGGILIYTAVPDAEGTLGGLVSLAEPVALERIVQRALRDAQQCSSDPLCAERLPQGSDDFLHGAACHICLFVSETTCERGNRFLDRRFVVPVADPKLALIGEDSML